MGKARYKSAPGFKLNFFLLHESVQKERDKINPPIQIPETVSSIPSHLDNPRPATTATVQTGQTAWTEVAENKNNEKKDIKAALFLSIIYCTIFCAVY